MGQQASIPAVAQEVVENQINNPQDHGRALPRTNLRPVVRRAGNATDSSSNPYRTATSRAVASYRPAKVFNEAPSPDTRVPAGTTYEEYLYKYANHLTGQLMNQELFVKHGIKRGKPSNEGNFFHKRIGRVNELGEAGLRALWSQPHYTYARGDIINTPQTGTGQWLNAALSEVAKDAKDKEKGRSTGKKEEYDGPQPSSPLLQPSSLATGPQTYAGASNNGGAAVIAPRPNAQPHIPPGDERASTQPAAKQAGRPVRKPRKTARQAERPLRRANQKRKVAKREDQLVGPNQTTDSVAVAAPPGYGSFNRMTTYQTDAAVVGDGRNNLVNYQINSPHAGIASYNSMLHANTSTSSAFTIPSMEYIASNTFSLAAGINLPLQPSTSASNTPPWTQMTQNSWVREVATANNTPKNSDFQQMTYDALAAAEFHSQPPGLGFEAQAQALFAEAEIDPLLMNYNQLLQAPIREPATSNYQLVSTVGFVSATWNARMGTQIPDSVLDPRLFNNEQSQNDLSNSQNMIA